MSQTIPEVSQADVDRVIVRDFPADTQERVGRSFRGVDNPRVRLAVLKLANGDADALAELLEQASTDFRDIIAAAENPRYLHMDLRAFQALPATERAAVVQADADEYERWLHAESQA